MFAFFITRTGPGPARNETEGSMLQGFRNHKRWMMALIIGPISIAFVATGIYSYSRSNAQDKALAVVGGSKILPEQFDHAKREQLERLRQQLGEKFKSNMLDNQEARAALLSSLIAQRALGLEVANEGIIVSKQQVVSFIKNARAFQIDGKFDPELYKRYLSSQGKSDEGFVAELQRSMANEIMPNNVGSTSPIARSTAMQLNRLLREQREVRLLAFPSKDFLGSVSVTDEQAKAYFDAHQKEFIRPESEKVQYVVLSPERFMDTKPSEDDLKTYYQQNLKRFATPEQRRARHILLRIEGDGKDSLKKAEDLAAQLRADPGKFAEAAGEHSVDTGSAKNGGDLGWFGRGMMVPAFEQAVFGAKKGEVVGPVKSEFGYHIILVEDTKGGEVQPLEKVRARIEADYGQQVAQQKYAEAADGFSNLVYEQADSLQPAIDRYGLTPVVVDNVTRDGLGNRPEARFLNAHMIDLLFASEAVAEKRNTQAIEVANNVLVAARVLEHRPAAQKPFEEVKEEIVGKLRQEAAAAAGKEKGEKALEQLRKAPSDEGFAPAVWVSRGQPMGHAAALLTEELRVPADKLPAYVGVALPDGYAVARVLSSKVPEMSEDDIKAASRELAQLHGSAETDAYFAALQNKLGTEIKNKDYLPPKALKEQKK